MVGEKTARKPRIPVIYVNDNFGQWRSDMHGLLDYCLRPEAAGCGFVEALKPDGGGLFRPQPDALRVLPDASRSAAGSPGGIFNHSDPAWPPTAASCAPR